MTEQAVAEEQEAVETLDSVFIEEESATEEVVEETATEEPDEAKGATKEEAKEDNSEEKSEDKSSEPPSEEETKTVPIAALHDARRKEKAAQEELAKYRAMYDTDEAAPDPIEDPDGYKEHVRSTLAREMHEQRVNESRTKMLEEAEDYESMERTFMVLAGLNPELINDMNSSNNPAKFAYDKGREYYDEQRELLKAEILSSAKDNLVQEETTEQPVQVTTKQKALEVPSLTKATAVGKNGNDDAIAINETNINDCF
jgi:hypothetical protein